MTDIVNIPSFGTWSDIAAAINHNTAEGLDKTNIKLASGNAAGTGNATINKPTGRVFLVAGVTSITITNNLVTADSNIFCTVMKLDAASIKNVVATTGQFVIHFSAGATGPSVPVAFMVVNPST